MIGRIQDKNVSVPLNETASSQGVIPHAEKYIQDSEDRPAQKFGVGSVRDGFEDDLLKKVAVDAKSIVEPVGYPGEEWLWEE